MREKALTKDSGTKHIFFDFPNSVYVEIAQIPRLDANIKTA